MLLMSCLVLLGMRVDTTPDLKQVYAHVKKLKGVEIKALMVRPSSIPMEFKIAPEGKFYAKYPTSEAYISRTEQVDWFPDRREYSKAKSPDINPLPPGFEILWPEGQLLQADGKSHATSFAGKPAIEIPCKVPMGHNILLYVNPVSFLPVGSIATAQGTEYEMRYLSVKEKKIRPASLVFVPPADATPSRGVPPDSNLIKPGVKLTAFSGKDASGKTLSTKKILDKSRGIVINFWFSACTGCVQEMPFFAKIAERLKEQEIGLIGANPIDQQSDAIRTAQTNRLTYPTLIGSGAKELAKSVGIIAYPVTVVVDKNGVVVDAILGFDEPRILEALKKIGYKPTL